MAADHHLRWRHAFGDRYATEAIRIAGMAPDASHILRRPQAILLAESEADVAHAMRLAARTGVPVTFRSGGTSLSGQAGSEGVLIDTRRAFRSVEVLDGGARVRCGPGATVDVVNAYLAPFGRALGPDPASSRAATIGGVVANNSSGWAAGTTANSYRTIAAMRIVLPSGAIIIYDAGVPEISQSEILGQGDADPIFKEDSPQLYDKIVAWRNEIANRPDLVAEITRQFSIKNTMGYALNAFVDGARPIDILAGLMVGSEGTLGFISEVTFNTVPVLPCFATALVVFPSLTAATDALPALKAAGAAALELLDTASINSVQPYLTTDDPLKGITGDGVTALIVEVRAATPEALAPLLAAEQQVIASLGLHADFTQDEHRRELLWNAREGLYTFVAGARPPGSTALLEDVAVPLEKLSAACSGLTALFHQFGFDDGVIFGHAKDGNIHFMITLDTADQQVMQNYAGFTEAMVELILGLGGTLKAEHGTGRIMAPFVERQYGPELYRIMCEIKQAFDPHNILNPGTIINPDPNAHLEHIKVDPVVDPFFDRCVTCGFCEPVCPSRDLTLTPRQRLQVLRRLAVVDPESAEKRELDRQWPYWAVDTCAADSLCDLACPVDIDTGVLMKRFRAQRHGPLASAIGAETAKHWGALMHAGRALMAATGPLPRPLLDAASHAARAVLPDELLPRTGRYFPHGGPPRRSGQLIGAPK